MSVAATCDRILLPAFRDAHPSVRRAATAWLLLTTGAATATGIVAPNSTMDAALSAAAVCAIFTAFAVAWDCLMHDFSPSYKTAMRTPRSRLDQLRGATRLLLGWCCSAVLPMAAITMITLACVLYPPTRAAVLVVLATTSAAWRLLRR